MVQISTKHDKELIDLAYSTSYPDTIEYYMRKADTEAAREILGNILYQLYEEGLCEEDEPRRRW